MTGALLLQIRSAVDRFVPWLESFGETSQDHQDFFACGFG